MRLGCCLVSSDLNPLYLDFFPIVRRVWVDLMGVPLKLALVSDRLPLSLNDAADDVILFPPIRGVKTTFQAQCLRLLLPALMDNQSRGDAVLISDIDMIPMSRGYYLDSIAELADSSFVVFRNKTPTIDPHQIAICYNAATLATWNALLGGIAGIGAVRERLEEWARDQNAYADGRHGGTEWFADQRILFDLVTQWKQGTGRSRVVLLDDKKSGFRRLDRMDLISSGELSKSQARDISDHNFTDYHMLRPLARYREINHQIVSMLLGERTPQAIKWRCSLFYALLPWRRWFGRFISQLR